MKKKNAPKGKKKASQSKKKAGTALNDSFQFSEPVYWGLTLFFVITYYVFSTQSVGFYQQDEVAHFIKYARLLVNPKSILGVWAKPGFKLVYIIPSLLGAKGVLLTNCIFTALAAYFAGLSAKAFGLKDRMMVMLLGGFVPMLYQISFRNYIRISDCFFIGSHDLFVPK